MPTTKPAVSQHSQNRMRYAAVRQADERAAREGVPCRVFRRVGFPTVREVTWYVRTENEDVPEGCEMPEYVTLPATGWGK